MAKHEEEETEETDLEIQEDEVEYTPPTQRRVKMGSSNSQSAKGLRTFFDNNKKILSYVGGGIFVLIIGFIGYKYFYLDPLETEAQNAIYKSARWFEIDSFNNVLKGDIATHTKSMKDIATEYSGTKAGNLANYYIGVSLMKQSKYKEAIDYLEDADLESKIVRPLNLGLIGDAYCQLKDYNSAIEYYEKASRESDNDFTTPYFLKKAALVYEHEKKYEEAKTAYQTIKDKYSKTEYGRDIDKYLARASAHIQ